MRGYLRKRGKGSWTIEVSAGFDAGTGKRRRFTETVRGTKREAESALSALLSRVDTGSELDSSKVTVGEYLTRWLEHSRTRVRPTTWTRYEGLIRLHVAPHIGSLRLSKMRPAHVQALLDSMSGGGAAPRSVVQCYRVLSAAMRQARRWQLIATNPVEAVQPPRAERPSLTIPATEALRLLLDAARGTREEAALTVEVATGLRRGELLGLRWSDVDLDSARITVTSSLQRHRRRNEHGELSSELVYCEPKSDRGRRSIALPSFAVEALRRHRKAQSERRLLLGGAWNESGAVFDRGDGSPIDPDTFSQSVARIMKAAGLEGVRFHDLRHAYATTLLTRGVHPKVASEALGHSSVAFTLDTYSHVVPGLQEIAAKALDDAFAEATAVKLPSI